ncbi:gamma-glutamyltransferase family protein [Komagataeibacter oboediens]|uniref:gamma-glutamyltransferase family protein n=1 Tax=Komagataeibacter oboediens TaxID=65958 RepID=UPI001C2DDC77|nr:gamma-glutamyltransferase [Komagataeibacter oboediens]MBV1823925.1 gamma-glutamyltransferase [Komagataeibacter oboediens]
MTTGSHWRVADGYSSPVMPVLSGCMGAVSAAHPLAVAAGQEILGQGGSAVDAAIAAQAVLCVVSPDACGIGGDLFAIIDDTHSVQAISGAGAAPASGHECAIDGANSITVPGLPGAWSVMHDRWGVLPLEACLKRATLIAENGFEVSAYLGRTLAAHDGRLRQNGSADCPWRHVKAGDKHVQPQLAEVLRAFARTGPACFYTGDMARAIVGRVRALGGALDLNDMADHQTGLTDPLQVNYNGVDVFLQPPPTQGVLLGMVLNNFANFHPADDIAAEHVAVELTEASFAYRDRAFEGPALLDQLLEIDVSRAGNRGGPRGYLHTAGVCVTDAQGMAVSSLVSVFDDFGSCVFVPELGIFLNNRAGGFTQGANSYAPGKRPVHTLAPALLRTAQGTLAIATPGADGQVQTLLQFIDRIIRRGEDLATAIAAPRWRSQAGKLLMEHRHPARSALAGRGHVIEPMVDGAMCFGAIACAGVDRAGMPYAVGDWRRENWAGVI